MTSDLITRLSELEGAGRIPSIKRITIHRDHALLAGFTNHVRENIKRRQAILRAKEAGKCE